MILGLYCFHGDSSAALIRDGELVAAPEEERFRRGKHRAGFPSQAIAVCLAESGIALSDVDHIAINQVSAVPRSTPGAEPLDNSTRARVNVASLYGRMSAGAF
jgi:carbamoyltransferase